MKEAASAASFFMDAGKLPQPIKLPGPSMV
jgi:hypothetical protein